MQGTCVHLVKTELCGAGFWKALLWAFEKLPLILCPISYLQTIANIQQKRVLKSHHSEMLSAFPERMDAATPLSPAGTPQPKLCRLPISYPLTRCVVVCNSSFNPVPFPVSANPWFTWWMNGRTLNARLISKKIHPRSGCWWWRGLHHDSGGCPIREGSQGTFPHKEHWCTACDPLRSKESAQARHGPSRCSLARAQLSRAQFFPSGPE